MRFVLHTTSLRATSRPLRSVSTASPCLPPSLSSLLASPVASHWTQLICISSAATQTKPNIMSLRMHEASSRALCSCQAPLQACMAFQSPVPPLQVSDVALLGGYWIMWVWRGELHGTCSSGTSLGQHNSVRAPVAPQAGGIGLKGRCPPAPGSCIMHSARRPILRCCCFLVFCVLPIGSPEAGHRRPTDSMDGGKG